MLESIISNLNNFDQLRSYSFHTKNSGRGRYPPWTYEYKNMINRLNRLVPEIYNQFLPQLNRLNLRIWGISNRISLERLHCLILAESSVNELQMIISGTPKLRSLNVCLTGDVSNFETLNLPFQLKRLTLTINGLTDLADGFRWEKLSAEYTTFNIKIKVHISNIQQILGPFSTSFWLEEKRWYIAYDYGYLFSVPKFVPNSVHDDSYNPQHFTAPDKMLLYNSITSLIISQFPILDTDRFGHVEMLEFRRHASNDFMSILLNIVREQYTTLSPSNSIQLLLSHLHQTSRCHKLKINADIIPYLINKLSGEQFK